MDKLSILRLPVEKELEAYKEMFDRTLDHPDDFLGSALDMCEHAKEK